MLDEEPAQIVDAVGVVGMLVREEHRVEPIDLGVEELARQTTENFFRLFSKVPRPAAAAA